MTDYRILSIGIDGRDVWRAGEMPEEPRISLRLEVGKRSRVEHIVLSEDAALGYALDLLHAVRRVQAQKARK